MAVKAAANKASAVAAIEAASAATAARMQAVQKPKPMSLPEGFKTNVDVAQATLSAAVAGASAVVTAVATLNMDVLIQAEVSGEQDMWGTMVMAGNSPHVDTWRCGKVCGEVSVGRCGQVGQNRVRSACGKLLVLRASHLLVCLWCLQWLEPPTSRFVAPPST